MHSLWQSGPARCEILCEMRQKNYLIFFVLIIVLLWLPEITVPFPPSLPAGEPLVIPKMFPG